MWRDNSPYCRVWGTGIWGRLFSLFNFDASAFALINTKRWTDSRRGKKKLRWNLCSCCRTQGAFHAEMTEVAQEPSMCSFAAWKNVYDDLWHACCKNCSTAAWKLYYQKQDALSHHILQFFLLKTSPTFLYVKVSHICLTAPLFAVQILFFFSHCKASELLRRIAFDETNL